MALVKKIVKLNAREVIVKWTGTGTDTLTLASLIATPQALDGGTQTAYILSSVSSISGAGQCKITRNSEEVLNVAGNFRSNIDGSLGFAMTENPTSDIGVNLTTEGTLVLRVQKRGGYTGI